MGQRSGRAPAFDHDAHQHRDTVGRRINALKQSRGLATRDDKTATIHRAGLLLAGTFLWSPHRAE
ncbi:hypothetical protein [Streptomyces sp. NBC_00203]|uniref:hypothetical protein n=1 Tax=Streptomyces sp. NBC_00203 TaxID=2975680 RepID=UPI00324D7572